MRGAAAGSNGAEPAGGSVSGAAMTEDQLNAQRTQSEMHLSTGAGPQEEGGVRQVSEYCKDLLMRGREELSLEELRAERYFRHRQKDVEERLKHLTEVNEQLNQELEEKTRLFLLRKSHQQVGPEAPAATSFQIYDESQSAAARPAGNSELQDDVFLRPDERGLCLKIQFPRPGGAGPSELPQRLQAEDVCCSESGELQTPPPDSAPQEPDSKTTKKLSPIQETSVEAGDRSLVDQHQDQNLTPATVGQAMDPCDPEVRRRLLDVCDVTSSPGFHCESRPLPPVCGRLQLGGDVYDIYSTVVDGGSFSVYKAASDDDYVLIKVDRCRVPWDFHQLTRLKMSSAAALPLISCYLFLDGCVTVYTKPPDHMFTVLTECQDSVVHIVVLLLQLVSQLHSCRLLHAALQPSILTCSYRGLMDLDSVFPVDWSWSVDLDLQQDVTSVQQLPTARSYVSLGLLEPTSPPQLMDLVGVAETVHMLLTHSRMVLVKDDEGWTAERFSRDESCDVFPGTWMTWSRFFRSLLNAGGRSSLSVLSELTDQLSDLKY
ncbi:mitotic checkpoint serine/threonine-protein kinase BUB1 beta isoform X2 [Scophthalmus maximus]|uniref:mitotic checkpoint serine/threonine-protein kinase BUB1 beta isoform X2 n=1 Tax=Scophthalmus maximus TaxID=52904 RepID=UPI001FA860E9|nr:mitotic checkpoint serine/threonine-protein kinase BUB1 beta isoform X2 [Scophthalmus maximus]